MKKLASFILSIDQGTTGTTSSVYNDKGQVVASVDKDFRQIFPKPGWVEHDPEDIWKTVAFTVKSVLRKAKIQGAQVAAIGITNQRETVVMWDKKTGKPVHNAIVWQDRRTTPDCEVLKAQGLAEVLRDRTGLVIDPYFSASKISWMLKQKTALRTRALAGWLAVGTIDTFLIWRLSGGVSHVTDVSNASRTQLMNIKSGQWDDELLKIFSVPRSILPEIGTSSGELGVTSGLGFLPDGIPISGVAGDQQAALFGQNCFESGQSKCTFGTGSFLLMNTGSERVLSRSGLLTTVAWQLKGERQMTYALEGGAFVCGAAVQFLRDQFGFVKRSEDIEKLASGVKDAGGVEFVPALTGLGAPYWDPEARGLISGLTRGTTVAHIARATLEAMALQNAEILLAMQKDLGKSLKSVAVDGGAAANNLLMQLQADYLGVEVVRPKMIETTSAGAAYLAGLGVGLWSDTREISKIWKTDKVFKSKMSIEDRNMRLLSWRKAVDRARL